MPKPALSFNPPEQSLHTFFIKNFEELDDEIHKSLNMEVALIQKISQYILQGGGKRIRPLLTFAAFYLAQTTRTTKPIHYFPKEIYNLSAAVELIHHATLLHDDVVDTSELRRGKPAAHMIYGNAPTVLVGDYLFSKAFQLMVQCKTPGVLEVLAKASTLITQGEVLQISHFDDFNLSLEDYIQIITHKTAALFEASTLAGAMVGFSEDTTSDTLKIVDSKKTQEFLDILQQYGLHFGLTFQMLDDLHDYFPPENYGKTPGDDFFEGKVTLPIILLLKKLSDEKDRQWIQDCFLKQKQIRSEQKTLAPDVYSQEDFHQIKKMMTAYGIHEEIIAFVKQYLHDVREQLTQFPNSDVREMLYFLPFRGLAQF